MLEIGDVLYVYNTSVIPAESKYSVVVCLKPDLFFLINTKNRSIYNCIPIKKAQNPYLKYDSYLSCNVTFKYSLDQLKNAKKVGKIDYETLKRLYLHIKNNVRTIPQSEKDKILSNIHNFILDNIGGR